MGALLTQFMNRYAYTDFHELNADWLIKTLMEMINQVENFVSLNAIKYADPIQWDIVRQYEKNTVVIDPLTGTAYISVQPVPSGVALSRTEYWTVVFDLGSFVTRAAKNFSNRYEADTTLTATFPTTAGDWLVWGDTLYEALVNITAGDQYVVNSNIKHITMEEVVNALAQAIDALDTKVGDLDNLTTSDKTSIVNAINSVLNDLGLDISNINTRLDNVNIVNVIDFGAVGDGVTDDSSAISDAIATGKKVYFPEGTYLISQVPSSNDDLLGFGVLVLPNTHVIPVKKGATCTLYDNDFSSLSDLYNWANNLEVDLLNIYYNNTVTLFNSSVLPDLNDIEVHLYPLATIEQVNISNGKYYIHNPVWATVNAVYHLLVRNGAECHVVGTETVHCKTNNFHFWVRENARLFLNNVVSDVDANCIYQFFIYAETGAVVTAEGYTWTGTPGTTWGASFTQGALGEFNVNSWRDFITFFPTSWSSSGTESAKDYMLPFCNVGSIVGSIPDYGWKPFFGENGYDLTGQTFIQADNIPDIYTMIAATGTNIKTTGYIHIQIRRMFQDQWDVNLGDYEGIDIQVPSTPYVVSTSGASITNPKVNVGGVDYPVTYDAIDGGSITLDSRGFRTNNSVSACYSGAGSQTIEFQICFIQYQGLDRPQYIGYISDGAGTKHFFQGVCKNYGRIASVRVIFTDACTQGNANILMNA